MTKRDSSITFIFSSVSLILLFAASASPIPTYVRLQERYAISTTTISLTGVCYFIGCIIALVVFARLSNHVGRKPVAIVTVLLGMTGLAVLMIVNNGITLLLARFLQGVSCGLASSTLSIFIIESGLHLSEKLVTTVSGSAVLLGLAIGGFLSGVLTQLFAGKSNLTYLILLVALVVALIGLLFSVDTVEKRAGALKSLKVRVKLPASTIDMIVGAAGCFIATWAFGGYFQAFSAMVSKDFFHFNSPLLAAVILVAYMAPNVIGSNLSSRFTSLQGQRLGIIGFLLAIVLILVTVIIGNLALYLIAVIGASIMQGIAYTSAMNSLLKQILKSENSEMLSLIYIISYAGAGIPSLIAGQVSKFISFYWITVGYVIFTAVVAMVVLYDLRKQQWNS